MPSCAKRSLPAPPSGTDFWSLTRTRDELSLVCAEAAVPLPCLAVERNWCAFVIAGPLDFALVGVLAALTATLAQAEVSLFATSTYDTDYLLVKEETRVRAIAALREAGHTVETETEWQLVKKSKYLARHLRHSPERIGLTLEEGGWVLVDDLLAACREHQFSLTWKSLDEVVQKNSKKRFSFDETGTKIRANQGHSVEVDLQLAPTPPPDVLYHGTGHGSVALILQGVLHKMNRHHVNLSADVETATGVGARHGRPGVLAVDAKSMHDAGHRFYVSNNGLWIQFRRSSFRHPVNSQ